MHILTLTLNPAVDASTRVRRVEADAKLRCVEPVLEPGGGGLNVARVLRELGRDALALYPAGGHHGRLLEQLVAATGIRHRVVSVAGQTRQNLLVVEEGTGCQYRFTFPGALLSHEEQEAVLAAVLAEEADLVVVSGSLPPGVRANLLARLATALQARGTRLVMDVSGTALRLAARTGVFLLKPNVREFCALAGCAVDDGVEPLALLARQWIADSPSEVLVLSLGRRGAILATAAEVPCHFHPPELPEVSAVGAGDSMVAGIVHGLAGGAPLEEAVRLGVAAGAAAVLTPGSRLCRRQDVEVLLPQVAMRRLARA